MDLNTYTVIRILAIVGMIWSAIVSCAYALFIIALWIIVELESAESEACCSGCSAFCWVLFVLPFLLLVFSFLFIFGVVLPLVGVIVINRSKNAATVLFLLSGILLIISGSLCGILYFGYVSELLFYWVIIFVGPLIGGVLYVIAGALTAYWNPNMV